MAWRPCFMLYGLLPFALPAKGATTLFDWKILPNATLPKALSDHTVSRFTNNDDIVYIAGGCDSERGNEWIPRESIFACMSVSDSFFALDLSNYTVTRLPDMPFARYRHASVAVNHQIWLLGGRTGTNGTDTIVSQIDIFDTETGAWSTFDDLSFTQHLVSDHAGFAWDDRYAYFVGGYNQDYTAQTAVFSFDATASNPLSTLREHAPMSTERGDLGLAVDPENGMALAVGGFTQANAFCAPLASSEWYNITADEWTTMKSAELTRRRADMALVYWHDQFYVLGGERQIEGLCDSGVAPEPGDRTIPMDQIQVLDLNEGRWSVVGELPYHRFRFAAVAHHQDEALITLGGQQGFDQSCDCFPTTNDIVVHETAVSTMAPTTTLTTQPSVTVPPTTLPTPTVAPSTMNPTNVPTVSRATLSNKSSLLSFAVATFIVVALC